MDSTSTLRYVTITDKSSKANANGHHQNEVVLYVRPGRNNTVSTTFRSCRIRTHRRARWGVRFPADKIQG